MKNENTTSGRNAPLNQNSKNENKYGNPSSSNPSKDASQTQRFDREKGNMTSTQTDYGFQETDPSRNKGVNRDPDAE